MHIVKSVKIALSLAVLLLVAKPFLGFSVLSQLNNIKSANIYVKAFTKRKQEYVDGSEYSALTFQKKLAEPVTQFLLRIWFLLNIILPFAFLSNIHVHNLRGSRPGILSRAPSYLLYSTLLI